MHSSNTTQLKAPTAPENQSDDCHCRLDWNQNWEFRWGCRSSGPCCWCCCSLLEVCPSGFNVSQADDVRSACLPQKQPFLTKARSGSGVLQLAKGIRSLACAGPKKYLAFRTVWSRRANRHFFVKLFVFPESVVKGLTTEVVVASYNSNSLNIILVLIFEIKEFLSRGEGNRDYRDATMGLPWRYHGGGFKRGKCVFVTVVIEKRRSSRCSRLFAGVREVFVAQKLVVSAPFRFGSDDPLGVEGCSRRSRDCRDAKTSSFGTMLIRK